MKYTNNQKVTTSLSKTEKFASGRREHFYKQRLANYPVNPVSAKTAAIILF